MTAHEIEPSEFYRLTGKWPEGALLGCVRCGSRWFVTEGKGLRVAHGEGKKYLTCASLLLTFRQELALEDRT